MMSSAAPDRRAHCAGEADAEPQRRQPIAPPGADEIARDDADDQRRLDAFAKHDERMRSDGGRSPIGRRKQLLAAQTGCD